MHNVRLLLAPVVAALAAAPASLAAQSAALAAPAAPASSTKGFFLGAHLNGSALTADDFDDETESGGGLGIQVGYGFTPRLALVVEATGAALQSDGEDVGFGHFDLALRYAFTAPTRRFVPLLEAGVTGRALAQNDVTFFDGGSSETGDLSLTGAGFSFGGGAQYYVSPKVALGATLKWTVGEFDTVKFNNISVDGLGIDATSARFNVGVTWYPRGGR